MQQSFEEISSETAKKVGWEKLAPCRTDGRLLLRAKFFQVQSHVTQKTKTGIKNLTRTNLDIIP